MDSALKFSLDGRNVDNHKKRGKQSKRKSKQEKTNVIFITIWYSIIINNHDKTNPPHSTDHRSQAIKTYSIEL